MLLWPLSHYMHSLPVMLQRTTLTLWSAIDVLNA